MCRVVERHTFCQHWAEGELALHRSLMYLCWGIRGSQLELRFFPKMSVLTAKWWWGHLQAPAAWWHIVPVQEAYLGSLKWSPQPWTSFTVSMGSASFGLCPNVPLSESLSSSKQHTSTTSSLYSLPCEQVYQHLTLSTCLLVSVSLCWEATSPKAERLALWLMAVSPAQGQSWQAGETPCIFVNERKDEQTHPLSFLFAPSGILQFRANL